MSIKLHGRSIVKGIAEGEALVTAQPIGFNFGVDGTTGTVLEHGHELLGQSLKDKVLIFPNGKGSTGGSFVIYQIVRNNCGPLAMVNVSCEAIIAVGAIMAGIPTIDSLDQSPIETIQTGDYVRVNGNDGTLEILRRKQNGNTGGEARA